MARYVILVKFAFDSGTEYYSFEGVSLPTQHYSDRLRSIGHITREVPHVPGQYRVADATIELDDTDNHFGALKALYSFRNREVTIYVVNAETGATLVTLWTAKISGWEKSGSKISFQVRDDSFTRLYGKLPVTIFDDSNFPNIPSTVERGMVPHVYGEVSAYGASGLGRIKATLVTSSNPFQYVVAQHRIYDVLRVYVYGVLKTETTHYTVTTASIGGVTYDVIQFTTDQRDSARANETEVTVDVQGYDNSALVTNPVDQLRAALIAWGLETSDTFPSTPTHTSQAVTKCTNKGMAGAMYLDDAEFCGVDLLDIYAESFNLIPYRTKEGLLAVYKADLVDEVSSTPWTVLTDENDIIRDSLVIRPIENPISRLQANYLFNWIPEKQYFEKQPRPNDEVAEGEILIPTSESINLWAVKDALTAEFVRRERRYMLSEGVCLVSFELPFEYYYFDLCDWVALTSRRGIGENGFVEKMMRIIALDLDLTQGQMKVVATCVAYPSVLLPDIGGCKLALDALHIDHDAGVVSTWKDLSEADNDVTQSTGANKPTLDPAGGPNGYPAVSFDGGDYLTKTGNIIGDDTRLAVFAVFKLSSVSGTQTILAQSESGAVKIALYTSGSQLRFTVDGNSTYAYGTVAANTWYYVCGKHDDAGSPKTVLYINSVDSPYTASANRVATAGTNKIAVGALDNGSNPMTGGIVYAGVVCRSVAVLAAERETMEATFEKLYEI